MGDYSDCVNIAMGNWLHNGGTLGAISFEKFLNYELHGKYQTGGSSDNSEVVINLLVTEIENLIKKYSEEVDDCQSLIMRQDELLLGLDKSLNQIKWEGEKRAYNFVLNDLKDLKEKLKVNE